MAKYQITGPDGANYLVEAPDTASDAEVMAYVQKNAGQPQQQDTGRVGSFAAPNLPSPQGHDIAESAKAGLIRGAAGLATLPGNIEMLGRAAINYGAKKIGGATEDVVSPQTVLGNLNDAEKIIEHVRGKPLYRPQTTAGKYAGTVAEFAPNMVMGGPANMGARALTNVVAPGVASEAAGQLTEGTGFESAARVAGAVAGGQIPRAAARAVSPVPNPTARQQYVNTLEREGVTDLTAGQKTGRSPLRYIEDAANETPFSGGRTGKMFEAQGEQFTRAALKKAGIDAPRATPDVLDAGFTRIGQAFDDMAQNSRAPLTPAMVNRIERVAADYADAVPQALKSPMVDRIVGEVRQLSGSGQQAGNMAMLTGERYQSWRSSIERAARGASDPYLATALRDLRSLLDDAVENSLPSQMRGKWQDVRNQYKNMLVIEKAATGAGADAAQGLISPQQLRTATVGQNRRAYARGKGDMAELARAGSAIMDKLPNSGTAQRARAMDMVKLAAGGAAGGAAFGPAGFGIGALAPFLLQGVASRGVMSRPMQSYLSNQVATPIANKLATQSKMPAGMAAIVAALSGDRQGTR